MTREQMFHELKHAKKKRPQRQRVAIVLNTERACGRRTNPPTVLQLGKIIEFEVINPKTKAEGKVNARTKQIGKLMRNARLAWTGNGKRGTLHICTPIKNSRYNGKKHTVSKNVRRKHMNFHGADVGRVLPANMPKRPRKVTQIGLVKAVVYQAVGIKSPSKQKRHWHHLFGDSGHRGLKKGPRYMPMLATDGKNLFIIRRPGNTYYVGMYDDGHAWIIG